jgi:glycosyltransferase involved in cell wall biosynthesis
MSPLPLRLAIVTETFAPEINGVAMTWGVLARELAERGHAVNVWRPRRADLRAARLLPGVLQCLVPGWPLPGYPTLRLGAPSGARLRAAWAAPGGRPDLVHVVTEGPLGASAVAAARRMGIPVTSRYHTHFQTYTRHYGFGCMRGCALAWLRRLHNRTRRTFVPTAELAQELRGLGFERVGLLSRGVDTRQFGREHRSAVLRAEWGASEESPVVVNVGRVAAEKNFNLLLRAYEAMRVANPALRFVVVGDGPLRARWARACPWIKFTGFREHGVLAPYYASADIYIHSSTTETFGNVLTEAMASGLAVAGFDYAAARLCVRDGVSGLLAPLGDEPALIVAATRLAQDAGLRTRLAEAASVAVAEISWSRVVDKLVVDFREVVGARAC